MEDIKFYYAVVERVVVRGERPEIAEDCPSYFEKLMKDCWEENASSRPTATECLQRRRLIEAAHKLYAANECLMDSANTHRDQSPKVPPRNQSPLVIRQRTFE
jgi:hypothetical protein